MADNNLFGIAVDDLAPAAAVLTEPFRTMYVHFESKEDIALFSFVVDQVIQENTRNMFYPELKAMSSIRYPDHKFDNAAEQFSMFGDEPWWHKYWQGMPEFISEDLTPLHTIHVHFMNQEDVDAFSAAVEQAFTELTKWIWYPSTEIQRVSDKRWVGKP